MDDRSNSSDQVEEDEYYNLDKVTFLPGAITDAVTFALQDEDHTLGNALRYIIMKNPQVEFCGYSAPHPSEPKIHLRIQMYDGHSATAALAKGLDDLEALTRTIQEAYENALAEGNYERTVEPTSEERLAELIRTKYPHLQRNGEQAEAAQ